MAEQLQTRESASDPYTQNVLSTRVDVAVTVASKKATLEQVLNIVPGAVLRFNSRCDQLLSLELSGQEISQGSPVRVGDRMGLRVVCESKS